MYDIVCSLTSIHRTILCYAILAALTAYSFSLQTFFKLISPLSQVYGYKNSSALMTDPSRALVLVPLEPTFLCEMELYLN